MSDRDERFEEFCEQINEFGLLNPATRKLFDALFPDPVPATTNLFLAALSNPIQSAAYKMILNAIGVDDEPDPAMMLGDDYWKEEASHEERARIICGVLTQELYSVAEELDEEKP